MRMATLNTTLILPPLTYHLSLFDRVSFFVLLAIYGGIWTFALYNPRHRPWMSLCPAGHPVNPVVACFSMSATCVPPIISLGFVNEVYTNGTLIWFHVVGIIVGTIVTAHLYAVVYYTSGVQSSFEYVGRRFSLKVRKLVAFFITTQYLIFLPFVFLTPVFLFKHVMWSTQWIILISFFILTIPPTFCNSLRAVALNDLLTYLMTIALMSTLISFRSSDIGGLEKVWNITMQNDVLQLPGISSDPYERHTVWTLLIGGSVMWCSFMCFNPVFINRCLAVNSLKSSQTALWFSLPFTVLMVTLTTLCGLVCYATFLGCDPIQKFNEIPFYVEELTAYLIMIHDKGSMLPGIFVGTIIAWSVGYVSYSLNVICDLMVSELLRPFSAQKKESTVRILHRGLMFSFVVLDVVLILFYPYSKNAFMMAIQTFTAIGAPLLGLFTLGLFIPWANAKGAVAGFITSLFITLWITIGHQACYPDNIPTLYLSIDDCTRQNISIVDLIFDSIDSLKIPDPTNVTIMPESSTINEVVMKMYQISYLWIPPISTGIVLVLGSLISLCTGGQFPVEVDTTLLCPLVATIVTKTSLFRQRPYVLEPETSESRSLDTSGTPAKPETEPTRL